MVNHNINRLLELPTSKTFAVSSHHITPEVAQHWLSLNSANRHVVLGKLRQFQNDMERGEWMNDGSPIRFSPNRLLDGQHRLIALVQVGCTLPFVIVVGLDDESQVNMDTGRCRTPADVLGIEGLGLWEAKVFGTAVHPLISHMQGLPLSTSVRHLNREARNFYLEHAVPIQRTLRVLHDLPRKPTPLPWARAATMHYLFSEKDGDLADRFFRQLYEGENLTKTQPIYHLRNRLLNDAMVKTHRSLFDEYFAIIRAWNATRRHATWKLSTMLYPGKETELPEIF